MIYNQTIEKTSFECFGVNNTFPSFAAPTLYVWHIISNMDIIMYILTLQILIELSISKYSDF